MLIVDRQMLGGKPWSFEVLQYYYVVRDRGA